MKLLLIDGHYYVYRSFFAIQNLSNSRGEPTNAIYGFIKTVRRMVKDLSPDLGAVVWDEGLPARRTELQPEYKATRVEMPEPMRPQLEFIRRIVPELGFASLGLADTEADDLMASYTCTARRAGHEVVLATNDKDLFQLVDGDVRVYSTAKADLASPKDSHALLGADAVRRKWNVEPAQIADVLALIGDSVDNIPGINGLGPKTAASLLAGRSLQGLLDEDFASVPQVKLRTKLQAARAQIEANREMVRLDLDLPLPVPIEQLQIRPRYAELIAGLEPCEFKSLMLEIKAEAAVAAPRAGSTQGELF